MRRMDHAGNSGRSNLHQFLPCWRPIFNVYGWGADAREGFLVDDDAGLFGSSKVMAGIKT